MKRRGRPLLLPKWSSGSACTATLYLEQNFGLYGGEIHSLPIGQSALPEVHGNVVNRRPDELWADFVSRAASETVGYLRSFNPSEIVEPGDVFFNVTWVNEREFQELGS
jgi:hypothetical protein